MKDMGVLAASWMVQWSSQGKKTQSLSYTSCLFSPQKGCLLGPDLKTDTAWVPREGSELIWHKHLCPLRADCIRCLEGRKSQTKKELTGTFQQAVCAPSDRHAAPCLGSGLCQGHCWVSLNQHFSQVNIDFVLVVLISVVEREAVNAWQNSSGPSWQLGSLICLVFCRLVLMGPGWGTLALGCLTSGH